LTPLFSNTLLVDGEGYHLNYVALFGRIVKTGRNQCQSSQVHAYEDGRQDHVNEYERRFVQMIANEIVNFNKNKRIQRLLLVAEPHIEAIAPLVPKNLQIQELAKDLCKLKPKEIYEYLAQKNLLPTRKQVSGWGN
jgi:protein required for attachment to host cells